MSQRREEARRRDAERNMRACRHCQRQDRDDCKLDDPYCISSQARRPVAPRPAMPPQPSYQQPARPPPSVYSQQSTYPQQSSYQSAYSGPSGYTQPSYAGSSGYAPPTYPQPQPQSPYQQRQYPQPQSPYQQRQRKHQGPQEPGADRVGQDRAVQQALREQSDKVNQAREEYRARLRSSGRPNPGASEDRSARARATQAQRETAVQTQKDKDVQRAVYEQTEKIRRAREEHKARLLGSEAPDTRPAPRRQRKTADAGDDDGPVAPQRRQSPSERRQANAESQARRRARAQRPTFSAEDLAELGRPVSEDDFRPKRRPLPS
ncbi:uncharacterized protein LTR77_000147 [Saxophila tyrrhenica]|uniref:Uncharacterized protein n=1 Tax=Saxophila tyrrhenica TaxID=1690608 RepID=A0AAV9PMR9_9PEZI|nr:hypothetical protein LTR77_000147 [Saxophila tyrrhenica]